MKTRFVLLLSLICILSSCGSPSVPENYTALDTTPSIFPDYVGVTVPSNIAPLNFMVDDEVYSDVVAEFVAADGYRFTCGSDNKAICKQTDWEKARDASAGKSIQVTLYAKDAQSGEWSQFKTFPINVAAEPIDDYISYRLIEPGYVIYNKIALAQRQLSSFDESEIFNNQVTGNNRDGQCINCHSYQNYSTDNMLFHVRVLHGGTVLVVDGKPRKVDLKRPYTISAGVYPSWHPKERLVAFSTDQTHQLFHTADKNKVEVFDDKSDLILYDIDRDSVIVIADDPNRLEVFPTWSPDGSWLYYCSATPVEADSTKTYRLDFKDLRYNLYRRSFDRPTLSFGEEEIVYQADTLGRSVSLPRISPDGKYIAFAEGDYGYFNIWHHEADIKILELNSEQQTFLNASALNTPNYAESYPSWSSNGHWIMCASRRDDGNYSRAYISYFDGTTVHKAFEIPQKDPTHNLLRLKSYNRPEFMKEKVKISVSDFAKVVEKD